MICQYWFLIGAVYFKDCTEMFWRKITFCLSGSGSLGSSWWSLEQLDWLAISSAYSAYLQSMITTILMRGMWRRLTFFLTVFLMHVSPQVNDVLVQLLVEHPVHEQHPPHSQQHGWVPWRASAGGASSSLSGKMNLLDLSSLFVQCSTSHIC